MDSLPFNSLLLEISDKLSSEQLERLKFLCSEDIRKREQERCTTGHKLFQTLRERGKLDPDNTDYLAGLLEQIHRLDLRDRLRSYTGNSLQSYTGEGAPQSGDRDSLELAAEVLSETLGTRWRRLGRKLGLTEVKLDSISQKHQHNLEDTAVELVRVWRKTRGDQATVRALVRALRDCDFNMTADNVEERLGSEAMEERGGL